jgi:hypothetical protein
MRQPALVSFDTVLKQQITAILLTMYNQAKAYAALKRKISAMTAYPEPLAFVRSYRA